MSSDNLNRNVVEFTRPVLVSETPVFDLSATRQKKVSELNHAEQICAELDLKKIESENICKDGVCVLSWRPRRPEGDVA